MTISSTPPTIHVEAPHRDTSPRRGLRGLLLSPLRLIRRHLPSFVIVNGLFLATFLVGSVLAVAIPALRADAMAATDSQILQTPIGRIVVDAYLSGDVGMAGLVTFAANLIIGSLLTMSVPSLVIPFFAVGFLVWRTYQWGLMFSPFVAGNDVPLAHYLTVLLEGGAYVLVAFAALLAGRMLLWPRRFGLATHRAGWIEGLRTTGRLYLLVIPVLLVAAFWEAFEIVHLVG